MLAARHDDDDDEIYWGFCPLSGEKDQNEALFQAFLHCLSCSWLPPAALTHVKLLKPTLYNYRRLQSIYLV